MRFWWGFWSGVLVSGLFRLLTLPPDEVAGNARAWLRWVGAL